MTPIDSSVGNANRLARGLAAAHDRHVYAARAPERGALLGALRGVVVRVVEHLDLQPVARVVEDGAGIHQPFNHVALVVDG